MAENDIVALKELASGGFLEVAIAPADIGAATTASTVAAAKALADEYTGNPALIYTSESGIGWYTLADPASFRTALELSTNGNAAGLYDNTAGQQGAVVNDFSFRINGDGVSADFDTANLTASRAYGLPNASGTIARTEDFAAPPAIGSTTRNTGAFTTLNANNGTLTASAPVLDLEQTWNNAAVTFTGLRFNVTNTASDSNSLFAEFQIGGLTQFSVRNTGEIRVRGTPRISSLIGVTWATWITGTYGNLLQVHAPQINLGADGSGSTRLYVDAAHTFAQRDGTNAQTFRIYNTYTNAVNYERGFMRWSSNVLQIGTEKLGTGSARGLQLQTDGATRFTLSSGGSLFIGDGSAQANNFFGWSGNGGFRAQQTSTGVITLLNWAETDFNRLQFGGTTSSFPALKRSSTALQVRLADDSGYAPLESSTLSANNGTITASAPVLNLSQTWTGGAVFVGNTTGGTLTVTSMVSGTIVVGHRFVGGEFADHTITGLGTGSGGVGTYTISFGNTRNGVTWTTAPDFVFESRIATDTASSARSKIQSFNVLPAVSGQTETFAVFKNGDIKMGLEGQTGSNRIFISSNAGLRLSTLVTTSGYVINDIFNVSNTARAFRLRNDMNFAWGSFGVESPDVVLQRDAAGTLAQVNLANPQTFRLYNTTDATQTNYERGFMRWSSNVLQIGTEASGTGSSRIMEFYRGVIRCAFIDSANFFNADSGFLTAGQIRLGAAQAFYWNGRAVLRSPATDQVTLLNSAETDFGRLNFGGTTSSFPALKRSSTALQVRLADDSAFAPLISSQIGIGVASPERPLHIQASDAMGRIDRTGANGPAFLMVRMATLGTLTSSWLFGPATGFASVANDDFAIIDYGTNVTGTSGTARLTIAKSDGQLTVNGNLNLSTKDLVTDTTTGTKIGTGTTQKIGFFNATPVDRPDAISAIDWDSTGDGGTTGDARDIECRIALHQLESRLQELGLIA